MKRGLGIGLGLVGLAALGLAAGAALAPRLAERAFARIVGETVGVDRSAGLADGLHVYLCGTGSPVPDPDRAGPCLGVLAGEHAFIFDSGSGSQRVLSRMGFPHDKLEGVFLTHLHSDHLDGLGEALLLSWIGSARTTPTPVWGPQGVEEVVAGINAAYAIDRGFRIAHHGEEVAPPAGFGGAAERLDATTQARPVWTADGVSVSVFSVEHDPVSPAFGYRVDYGGRSVVISGDTGPSEAVASAAQGVDVLVHDGMAHEMVRTMETAARANGDIGLATIFADIRDYHASPAEAAQIATQAGVRQLVLTHVVPPLPTRLLERAYLGEAKAMFSGPILVGRDGTLISAPAGSEEISISRALQ